MANELHVLPLSAAELASKLGEVAAEIAPELTVELYVVSAIQHIKLEISKIGKDIQTDRHYTKFVKEMSEIPGSFAPGAHLRHTTTSSEKFTIGLRGGLIGQHTMIWLFSSTPLTYCAQAGSRS